MIAGLAGCDALVDGTPLYSTISSFYEIEYLKSARTSMAISTRAPGVNESVNRPIGDKSVSPPQPAGHQELVATSAVGAKRRWDTWVRNASTDGGVGASA